MAVNKLSKNGYGQIELNQVAWRRDGRVEAQCALDSTEFPADGSVVAENGMLFAIDNVTRTLKKATTALATTNIIGINYSSEHLYDERTPGLKDFALTGGEDFLPRLGLPAVGDKFTTNTVCYNTTNFTNEEALIDALEGIATTKLYAGIASDNSGYWEIVKTAPSAGPSAEVIEYTTMPDGQIAVKLQIKKV